MAGACAVAGLFFMFVTTEALVRGKLKLPAWVFSSFTLVLGVFFFRIFINSVAEFYMGQHDSLDTLMAHLSLLASFFGLS
jgi:hypothetical protein